MESIKIKTLTTISSEETSKKITENTENKLTIDEITKKTMEWPSHTISIFNNQTNSFDNQKNSFNILTGTNTSNNEANYLIDMKYIPYSKNKVDRLKIKRKFKHTGNIIKATPFLDSFCVSASDNNLLYAYNLNQKCQEVSTKPQLILKGHKDICSGLSLNSNGLLLSSSYDGIVNLWDINSLKNNVNIQMSSIGNMESTYEFKKHNTDKINDVCWNNKMGNFFASCSNDKNIYFCDIRINNKLNNTNFENKISLKEINVVTQNIIKKISFNKTNGNLFLTANNRGVCDLWDLRNTKIKLHNFKFHNRNIRNIVWSTNCEKHFATAGEDGKLVIWNLDRISGENNIINNEDNKIPKECEFIYDNESEILDFDWEDKFICLTDTENHIKIIKLIEKNYTIVNG